MLAQSLHTEAFQNVVLANDREWMRKNLGSGALSPEGVQQLVIVDPHGRAVFSSVDEGAPLAERTASLLAAAASPMERARQLYRAARSARKGLSHRIPGGVSDGLYVNDIVKIDDRPAMITVAPFASAEALAPEQQAEPTLLIGIQFMTDRLLGKLETLSHIAGLRHVPTALPGKPGEHTHPIVDSASNVVARVTWDFSPPGYAILKAMLPAIALSLGLIALMTLIAAVTMRRMTHRLAESERTAVYASRHDAATGLANRSWFMRVFADLLASAGGKPTTITVLLIDCDYFKSVNDTLGHAAGDAVLAAIAERLNSLSDRILIAGRLGGDEFAVVTTPLANADDAMERGHDIEGALSVPVLFDSYVIMVGVSIGGVVLETPSTLSIDTWLARADMALYRAKRDGRGCLRFYDLAEDGSGPLLNPSTRNPANGRLTRAAEQAA